MNKIFMGILTILLLIGAACITLSAPGVNNPTTGKPPVAYIDSINPTTVQVGDSVTFSGHGTDSDGTIIGYEWRSSLNGLIGTAPSFPTTALVAGTHTITLRVLDNSNLWSAEVTSSIIVTPKAAKPVIEMFGATPTSVIQGSSIELRWNVSGAKSVTIDNGIGQVAATGSKILYPTASILFTLTAVNDSGSTTATASVTLQQTTSDSNPVISFTANHLGGTNWQLNWSVQNATQAIIEPDIGQVNMVGSTVVTVPSGQSKMYRLRAVNNWGWAYWQVVVMSP